MSDKSSNRIARLIAELRDLEGQIQRARNRMDEILDECMETDDEYNNRITNTGGYSYE